MSQDSYSEVTSQSWFDRITGAIKGVLVGIVLFLISFPLLWWNEGRAVHTAKGLQEAGGSVVSISADTVDPAQDKKLVHATALATTDEKLADPTFSVSVPAIKLRRKVEMYQWTEKESSETANKMGGGSEKKTTWTYSKLWSDKLIDSTQFKNKSEEHVNPAAMRYPSEDQTCKKVTFGAFTLPAELVSQMTGYEEVPLDAKNLDALPSECKKQSKVFSKAIYMPDDPQKTALDPEKPQVGDLRITFQDVLPAQVSIIACQAGNSFASWTSSTGTSIERLMPDTVSAADMVGKMDGENATLTWILRAVGFVFMALGIGLVFGPLVALADVLPFLGSLFQMGIGLFAVLVAASLSLATIAVAWLVYRPLMGVALLVVAAALLVGLKMLTGKKRQPAPAVASAPSSRPPQSRAGAVR